MSGLSGVSGTDIEHAVSTVTDTLLIPVLVLALAALALALIEAGRTIAEATNRRGRSIARLEAGAALAVRAREASTGNDGSSGDGGGETESVAAVAADDNPEVDVEATVTTDPGDATARALRAMSGSRRMARAADALLHARGVSPEAEARRSKVLADFDYASLKGLERPRVLVRAGPALGLMGTLIPLSPALQALAQGDVAKLAQDLRVAFSVTVLGLATGAIAFGVSLVRDRLYGQDLSDLEFLAAAWSVEQPAGTPADHWAETP